MYPKLTNDVIKILKVIQLKISIFHFTLPSFNVFLMLEETQVKLMLQFIFHIKLPSWNDFKMLLALQIKLMILYKEQKH